MEAERICNKDCLHCPYEDCINDQLDYDDYCELERLDKDFVHPKSRKQLMETARKQVYYEENREGVCQKKRSYYDANREKIHARQRIYYANNKERLIAYHHAYYQDNRDKALAYQRAYREAKRSKK